MGFRSRPDSSGDSRPRERLKESPHQLWVDGRQNSGQGSKTGQGTFPRKFLSLQICFYLENKRC